MKKLKVLALMAVMLQGCAAGSFTSATAGYSLRAKTAEELTPIARTSIIQEVKDWANSTFEPKITKEAK